MPGKKRVTPIVQEVYREHVKHFGEPADIITFDDGKPLDGFPNHIDVFVWDADDSCDITAFSTIGMSDVPLPKATHRCELHFSVRKLLNAKQKNQVAFFLANLAMYPFQIGTALDWWHTLSEPGKIPLFTSTECILLHPRFVKEGWDTIKTRECDVHLLNVVPITREEKDLKQISAILDRIADVDMFLPR